MSNMGLGHSIHSTAMALGKMSNQWLMNMDNGNFSAAVFLDIRKAFDTVDLIVSVIGLYNPITETQLLWNSGRFCQTS